jgi:hypothetical protein
MIRRIESSLTWVLAVLHGSSDQDRSFELIIVEWNELNNWSKSCVTVEDWVERKSSPIVQWTHSDLEISFAPMLLLWMMTTPKRNPLFRCHIRYSISLGI